MEALFVILLCIVAVLIAAFVICVWLVLATGKALWSLLGFARRRRAAVVTNPSVQTCNNAHCGCDNPQHARFCRRCGKSLPSLLQSMADKAAMF